MKKQTKTSGTNYNYIIPILMIAIIVVYCIGDYFGKRSFEEDGLIVQEGNITYKKYIENYYDVEYGRTREGVEFKINNPCIEITTASGTSMKPFLDNNNIIIYDSCFPVEDLEIGDIIMYKAEWEKWTAGIYPHHRIVDIDYEKRWVQTQGDNPETNPIPDDFVSFDRIIGKTIGFLNVLDDKRVVKKEVIEEGDFGFITRGDITSENITFRNLTRENGSFYTNSHFFKFDFYDYNWCKEVPCECHKWGCALYCFYCEDGLNEVFYKK